MEQKQFIQFYENLAISSKGYIFFREKLDKYKKEFMENYKRQLIIPDKKDINTLIDYICKITCKKMCVLIGMSEILSIFGINFYEQLNQYITQQKMNKNEDYNKINIFVKGIL